MAHDVFICHSSRNKMVADAICAGLEARGIRCWIAPRDVLAGAVWAASINSAIRGSRVMVLIYSRAANRSNQVLRELERAVAGNLAILPLRIEDVAPSDAIEYFIGASHWLDAMTEPLERHLEQLAHAVGAILGACEPEPNGHGRGERQPPELTRGPSADPSEISEPGVGGEESEDPYPRAVQERSKVRSLRKRLAALKQVDETRLKEATRPDERRDGARLTRFLNDEIFGSPDFVEAEELVESGGFMLRDRRYPSALAAFARAQTLLRELEARFRSEETRIQVGAIQRKLGVKAEGVAEIYRSRELEEGREAQEARTALRAADDLIRANDYQEAIQQFARAESLLEQATAVAPKLAAAGQERRKVQAKLAEVGEIYRAQDLEEGDELQGARAALQAGDEQLRASDDQGAIQQFAHAGNLLERAVAVVPQLAAAAHERSARALEATLRAQLEEVVASLASDECGGAEAAECVGLP